LRLRGGAGRHLGAVVQFGCQLRSHGSQFAVRSSQFAVRRFALIHHKRDEGDEGFGFPSSAAIPSAVKIVKKTQPRTANCELRTANWSGLLCAIKYFVTYDAAVVGAGLAG